MNHTERKLHERVGILEALRKADVRLHAERDIRYATARESIVAMIKANHETYLRGHAELSAKIEQGLHPLNDFVIQQRAIDTSIETRRAGLSQRATITYVGIAAVATVAAVASALVAILGH